MPVILSRAEARRKLVAHLGLARFGGRGGRGVRAVLERLRCIQLDPLDVIGTNADLVVMARVDGAGRGDVWRHLFPRHAFEHFAKERCILPASSFPWYRRHGEVAQTHWWRNEERKERVPPQIIAAVLDEVRARGPVTARELTDRGSVVPMDWSGWMGTSKATSMALEILWTRCDVVVGRTESGAKLYDVPERALGEELARAEPHGDFTRWALRERAHAAGLLTRAGGAMWSMLSAVRTSPVVDEMLAAGELIEVAIEESPRRYLAVPAFFDARARFDDRVRILGPLDPLLWDRVLVRHAFDFDYVWEVYKPAAQRKWGWYVCPLLHRDRLIGRVDAQTKKVWFEEGVEREVKKGALEMIR
ncbi:MAG TPA: winged helix DNA-binding domain-containing protein [Thermoanaerobaculia bacterium]|nr:winged helix DNA-binding domain-containing protein [Thermoanaerobaculia bacterium]